MLSKNLKSDQFICSGKGISMVFTTIRHDCHCEFWMAIHLFFLSTSTTLVLYRNVPCIRNKITPDKRGMIM